MKKLITILLFILVLFPAVSAISTDIRDTYQPKETMIIKVSGPISGTIDPSQVIFKRENIFVPVEYGVSRVGNSWYVWAVAPSASNNYSFILQDVLVSSGSGTSKETYQRQFAVNGSTSVYTVKPGIVVSSKDFSVELDVNDDSTHNIETDFPSQRSIEVSSGSNNIDFDISSVSNTQQLTINLAGYSIPAYITIPGTQPANYSDDNITNSSGSNTNQQNNSTNLSYQAQPKLFVDPAYIQKFVYNSSVEKSYQFTITNLNNYTQKNLEIDYNDSIFDVKDSTFSLDPNESYTFDLILNKKVNTDIKEKIFVTGTNISIEIPIFIRFTNNATDIADFYGENYRNATLNQTIKKTTYLCSELGGAVCSQGSSCSGESIEGKDGSCCLGICQQPEGSSYSWIGWILAIIVVGILWFVYYKYNKVGKESK